MFTVYLIVAEFVYSVTVGGVPPFRSTHLYVAEFSLPACADTLQRLQVAPAKFVKARTGDTPTWVELVIIPGWRCAALEVTD